MANDYFQVLISIRLAFLFAGVFILCPVVTLAQQNIELRPLGQNRIASIQDPVPAVPQNNAQDDDLEINLSERANLNLQGIVRWLAEVRGFKIVDDGKLTGKASQIQFYPRSTRVSKDQMFELVQGILRSNDLALVRSDLDGFYRIVALADVRPYAATGDPKQFPNAEFVTFVFKLKYITAQQADEYLRKTSSRNANASDNSITPLPNRNILIVTDTAKRLRAIADVIQQIDVPAEEIQTNFYKVKYLESAELEKQLIDLLTDTTQPPDANRNTQTPNEARLKIKADLRTNRLILIGSQGQIERALGLIKELDIDLGLKFVQYQLRNVAAGRIDELVKQSLAGLDETAQARVYQSSVNEQTNQLLVTARPEIHERIDQFVKQLDVSDSESSEQSPMRFYTLKNVKAADIVETLQSIEQRFLGSRTRVEQQRGRQVRGVATRDGFGLNGPNSFNQNAEGPLQAPPFLRDNQNSGFLGDRSRPSQGSGSLSGSEFGSPALNDFAQLLDQSRSAGSIIPGDAKITIDENTNTLIVVAPPAVQRLYADLIAKLDVRRPQVLVEVFVVSVDATDNFSLGIEISGGDRDGANRLFSFTSFGLSEVTAASGALSLIPGSGFNGTLVDPDVADVVLKALADHSCSRVVGAPKILVADNGTGVLSSVTEVPFTSINAANTVSTTSFAGFAQAGTTITVSPQISEDDYLNLEFDVLVNDFGSGDGEVPPRNTDQVSSQVRIPDGHTVIVGGLQRRRRAQSRTGVPILENIPVIRRLTSSETDAFEDANLFVFIKPIILRDDKFRDLQHLSKVDRRKAKIKGRFPQSKPLLVR